MEVFLLQIGLHCLVVLLHLVTFPEASETLNLSFPTLHFSSALYLN